MPAEVIDRVHVLAHRTVGAGAAGLAFTDRIGNPFLDPDNGNSSIDETYAPDASDMDDDYDPEMMTLIVNKMTAMITILVQTSPFQEHMTILQMSPLQECTLQMKMQNAEMAHEHHDNNEIENEHDNQEMDDYAMIIEHEYLQELPMTGASGRGNGCKIQNLYKTHTS